MADCEVTGTKTNRGFLPHEDNTRPFLAKWQSIGKRLRGGPELPSHVGERMRLDWHTLSMDVLADHLAPMLWSELYHCHEFVKAIGQLLNLRYIVSDRKARKTSPDLLDETSRTLRRLRGLTMQERRDVLEERFDIDQLSGSQSGLLRVFSFVFSTTSGADLVRQQIDQAIAASEYISEEVARYYFGKAREYVAQGIVRAKVAHFETDAIDRPRLDVIDLPSFPDSKTRHLALNSVLSTIWREARYDWASAAAKAAGDDDRVPTFIVVDEAHNLMPREDHDRAARALREQFRSIAAEGRKYGLFLILCTQRPDKIDKFIISECENRAIMRIGSQSVLDDTRALMGLEDVPQKTLSKCLEFGTGRALLVGRWVGQGPAQEALLYTAMRRTAEGGQNLREKHWAVPMPEENFRATSISTASSKPQRSVSAPSGRAKTTQSPEVAPALGPHSDNNPQIKKEDSAPRMQKTRPRGGHGPT